ncbi:MAG: asparagine synthase C-terminal domain-containing protein, partial [Pseudomonadota bacterium]
LNERVQTFTMGFGGKKNPLLDERPLAAEVAASYGCQFHEYTVEPDFRAITGDIVKAFDEPFADDSVIPSYYVSQLTRQKVKVALSGLGGDELFAGYQRYSGVLLSQYYSRWVPKLLHQKVIHPFVQRLPEPVHGGDRMNHAKRFTCAVMQSPAERYLGFVSSITREDRRTLFQPEIAEQIDFDMTDRMITDPYNRCNAPDDLTKALYVDMKTYLPEDILALSDRISMWHSLEVRVPLVDHRLVELAAQLPVRYKLNLRKKKILLKRLASRRLPTSVITHRKQGFESPMAAWLCSDLADYARDILGRSRLGACGIFNGSYVSSKLDEHISKHQKNNKILFSLIMFQEWYERQQT